MKVIFGIDPGSRFTGYGVIASSESGLKHLGHGVVTLPQNLSFAQKLHCLAQALEALFAQYQPTDIVVERIFLGKNADSAFKLGHVRGVCFQQAAQVGGEVIEYAARSVKKSVTGTGAASKEHVRLIVSSLLSIKNEMAIDASDALALAISHSRELEKQEVMQRQQGSVRL